MSDPWAQFNPVPSADWAQFNPKAAPPQPDATNPGMPTRGDVISPENMPQDEAAAWATTRIRNAATNFAGLPRGISDLTDYLGKSLGLSAADIQKARKVLPLPAQAAPALPSSGDLNRGIENTTGMKPVNTPGAMGPVIDAGTEAALGGLAGGPRALIPAAIGGAGQEALGSADGIKGTKWETPVRLATSIFGSLAPSLAQRGVEAATRMPALRTPENRAASILSRNLDRDKTTFGELQGGQLPGAPLVTNAGENVTGALRGATAAPGPARTAVNEAFDKYLEGSEGRVGVGITQNVSPLPPMSTRINSLQGEQSAAARPAYEAAGIPSRPEMVSPERKVQFAIDEPPTTIPAKFNTPIVTSPRLEQLTRDSSDIRSAIASVRGLPDYKNLPANSMTMWDKAYKRLNDMEQSALRAGKSSRANDIKNLRQDFKTALVDANPRYGRALDAYSEPQKLIDAAATGRDVFSKNVHPEEAARIYGKMPPDQQKEFLGGVADYLRTKMGNSDRTTAGERLLNSENERGRLASILPAEDNARFNALIEQEKAVAAKAREVTKGSRTVPMANEQMDNAGHNAGALLGILHKVSTGNYGLAALDMVKSAAAPIAKRIAGKSNEATNATLANWLTETDPQKIGLVRSLAERAQAQEAARRVSQQRGLTYGALAPSVPVLSGTSR